MWLLCGGKGRGGEGGVRGREEVSSLCGGVGEGEERNVAELLAPIFHYHRYSHFSHIMYYYAMLYSSVNYFNLYSILSYLISS